MGLRGRRTRRFADEARLTATPLMGAAEGAVDAYTRQSGGEWKPAAGPITVSRQATEAETAAFG
jgi:hypothetical protein